MAGALLRCSSSPLLVVAIARYDFSSRLALHPVMTAKMHNSFFKRFLAHALLALLLVLSQQMGIAHALAHGLPHAPAKQGPSHDAKSLAPDQGCEQCLAFAQIGSALDTPCHFFPASRNVPSPAVLLAAQPACQRTVCVFQPRAPPILA